LNTEGYIKFLLKKNGKTQEDLMELLNVTRPGLNYMFKHDSYKASTLVAIADFFNITVDELLRPVIINGEYAQRVEIKNSQNLGKTDSINNEHFKEKLKGFELLVQSKDETLREKERSILLLQTTNERYGRIIDSQLQQLQSS
jgi:transcriptional regulator with XRE-family HTH domain